MVGAGGHLNLKVKKYKIRVRQIMLVMVVWHIETILTHFNGIERKTDKDVYYGGNKYLFTDCN